METSAFSKNGRKGALARWGKQTLRQRFWKHVRKSTQEACWEWNAIKGRYPIFKVGKKGRPANRVAYELSKGPIPKGMCVCHSCDNPRCCNPSHLWAGTHDSNMKDMKSKGRARAWPHPGTRCWFKHTDGLVKQIRSEHVPRRVTARFLSQKYGISYNAIRGIIYGDRALN